MDTKKRFKIPHTYALIFYFVIAAVILTYIIPAGSYDMVESAVTSKKVIDPTSFHSVEQSPVGLEGFLLSIPKGMKGGATVIFLVFLVGGFFQIVNDTGAIDGAIDLAIRKLGDKSILVIPITMLILAILGAMGIVVNAVIAFIPIGVALAKKLDADPLVGVAIMYIGSYAGFTSSPMGPYNTLIGQSIAGLPPLSGFTFRLIVTIIIFVVSVWYVLKYTKKVQADINNSTLDDIEWMEDTTDTKEFNIQQALVLLTVVAGFVIYAYGTYKLKWSLDYISAVMLMIAIISGIITRTSADDMAKSFLKGAQSMVYGALIIGVAKSITIVLTEGHVIHSIIYYMTIPLTKVGPVIAALGMFFANLLFNVVVPSGSGQAMIVMPLMSPMADIVGVSRQIAVSAYQYGDGFSNIIIPTSGVLMAILGLAKIPYEKWVKFIAPLFGMWVAIGSISIVIGVLIGWN